MLLKQHPAAIDNVVETFDLSEGEKRFLLSAAIGEGLFFAGSNHVAVKVMASEAENKLITTNPEEMLRLREDKRREQAGELNPSKVSKPVYKPYVPPNSMDEYTTFDDDGIVKPDSQVKKIMSDVASEDFVEPKSNVLPPQVPETEDDDSMGSGTIEIKPEVLNSPNIPMTDKNNNNIEASASSPVDLVNKPHTPVASDKSRNDNKVESTSGGDILDSAINNASKPGIPSSSTNENKKPLENPTHEPSLQQKKPLDSRVVELRKKMLGEDGFLNKSPSAGDILDSVEEMRQQKQGASSQPTSENLNNPGNADKN